MDLWMLRAGAWTAVIGRHRQDVRTHAPNARMPTQRLLTRLFAGTALVALALPAAAQDATWSTTPGSGDFNTGANWTPAAVPTGTAFFGTSSTTALSFASNTTVGGWTFNAGASAYNFTISPLVRTLTFNGAGIVINGGSATIINAGTV